MISKNTYYMPIWLAIQICSRSFSVEFLTPLIYLTMPEYITNYYDCSLWYYVSRVMKLPVINIVLQLVNYPNIVWGHAPTQSGFATFKHTIFISVFEQNLIQNLRSLSQCSKMCISTAFVWILMYVVPLNWRWGIRRWKWGIMDRR